MLSVATDGVAWYVGLSVAILSSAKTAEPIEMPFGHGLEWAQGSMYHIGGTLLPITIGSGVLAQIMAECRYRAYFSTGHPFPLKITQFPWESGHPSST